MALLRGFWGGREDRDKLVGLVQESADIVVGDELVLVDQAQPIAGLAHLFGRDRALMGEVASAFGSTGFLVVGSATGAAAEELSRDVFAGNVLEDLERVVSPPGRKLSAVARYRRLSRGTQCPWPIAVRFVLSRRWPFVFVLLLHDRRADLWVSDVQLSTTTASEIVPYA